LDLAQCGGLLQRLSIGVTDNKLTPDQIRSDHVVNGVSPGAPYPNNGDAGLHLLLVSRDA
jgi:hypothetical protein